jgi:AraC family transcriptional regulator
VNPPATRPNASSTALFGAALAAVFNAPKYHCAMGAPSEKLEFAVTRLQSGPLSMAKAPAYPAEEALIVCVSLTPTAMDQWRARYRGHDVGVSKSVSFAATVLNLRYPMEMWVRGPFDYLHYYLSDALLKKVAYENGIASVSALREAFFIEDLVIAQLTRSILSPVQHGEPLDRLSMDLIATLLSAHVLQRYCGALRAPTSSRRGLKPWQRLRAEEMLRGKLDGNLTIHDLATACSLSQSHFAREFRQSFGTSVHQYLISLRIERAKGLLIGSRKKLSEIAELSGFCDQAALSRAFSRLERTSPARWRKRNVSGE